MKRIIITLALVISLPVLGQGGSYQIKNLEVNTKYSDFGTSYYGEEEVIFASSRPNKNKSKRNWTNGQPYLDLYKGLISSDGEISDYDVFSSNLNTQYHESNAVFTKDLRTVYFTRNNYYEGHYGKDSIGWNNLKMFRADVSEDGEWSNVVPMPFNDDNYSVGHPALSPDERTLYFTSDMPGSMGMTDIFKVSINGDGSYGMPENLGSGVNTAGKEMFPYVSQDGKLYFSSDSRAGGMGGLDIYVVSLDNLEMEPVRLSAPLNSLSDDFAFVVDEEKHTGYFSSNREGGHGDDDIYYFIETSSPEINCMQNITGVVRDAKTGALLPESTVTLYKDGEKLESVVVGSDASFAFEGMDCSTSYVVKAERELYRGDEETVNTGKKSGMNLNVPMNLTPDGGAIASTRAIDECQFALDNINNIYFDLDKYYIRPDAAIELEKVVKIMKRCKDIKIEARSHTDSRASHAYNVTLSENRAKSTVDYLIKRGIDPSRLKWKGFGETQLVNGCSDGVKCTEAEHQVNRRTEFVIINRE